MQTRWLNFATRFMLAGFFLLFAFALTHPVVAGTFPRSTQLTIQASQSQKSFLPLILGNSFLDAGNPGLYWGAYISASQYGMPDIPPWDMRAVDIYEGHTGKRISILHWGLRWHKYGQDLPFEAGLMESVRQRGALSLLDWTSQDYGVTPEYNQPLFALRKIIAGEHDASIRQFAMDTKSWGHPFFLRFDHEMNGDWYPWSEGKNGNQAGEFVQAWRHVHAIFTQVGVKNVTWVWCPNYEYEGTTPLEGLYPGDAYVDWTCIDAYNWGTNPARNGRWQSFDELYRATYEHILRIAPSKPVMIGEISSSEYGGDKAAWIADALSKIPREYPRIKALVWFNVNADRMDWVIETSQKAMDAFRRGIGLASYQANRFRDLKQSPIPAP